MRLSRAFVPTLKEDPADAELISHKLMIRAGMVRKLAAGIYTLLPLGWRVTRKVEQIVREEMDRAGCQELRLPILMPAELWQETGRWEKYGRELGRFRDRHDRDYAIGPTHEEAITDLVRNHVRSYRDMQVPGRDPPAFRRHARARAPHEGRLQLPYRRGAARGRLRSHAAGVQRRVPPVRTGVRGGGGGLGRNRRRRESRVHGHGRFGRVADLFLAVRVRCLLGERQGPH